MLTGSVVPSLQGEPRSTHDIDLVVSIPRNKVQRLLDAFPAPDYCLDEHSVVEAIALRGMFNLLDATSGGKVDFWLLKDDPFDTSRFGRRYNEEFLGIPMAVSRPEDTILMKLRWADLSGEAKSSSGTRCAFTKFSPRISMWRTCLSGPRNSACRPCSEDSGTRRNRSDGHDSHAICGTERGEPRHGFQRKTENPPGAPGFLSRGAH